MCSTMEIYTAIVHGIALDGSGISVLRTFRLLRILKLVRFLPNLRRQLVVMLRTMDNVAVFFALLMLFIFIFRWVKNTKEYRCICQCLFSTFSILGMNLFGCKFCEEREGTEFCDRKNFDSLLWATVTVFQVSMYTCLHKAVCCRFNNDFGQQQVNIVKLRVPQNNFGPKSNGA